jgi:hypothetical protein
VAHVLLGEPVSTSPEHALTAELALERFRVYREPRPDVLGDIADEDVLDAFPQRVDNGSCEL